MLSQSGINQEHHIHLAVRIIVKQAPVSSDLAGFLQALPYKLIVVDIRNTAVILTVVGIFLGQCNRPYDVKNRVELPQALIPEILINSTVAAMSRIRRYPRLSVTVPLIVFIYRGRIRSYRKAPILELHQQDSHMLGSYLPQQGGFARSYPTYTSTLLCLRQTQGQILLSVIIRKAEPAVRQFRYPALIRKEEGQVLITMVASLSEAKDQDTIIRALSELPEKYRVQLVGDGPRRAELETLAASMQLKERVDFLGIRSDIPQILVNSDINVMSSHWEGLSLSSIEGMSCGRPFIASDVDGLREVVKGHGVLFPHEDHQQLAKEIIRLTEDKEYADRIVRQCQAKAAEYDISVMAEKYNEVYKTLMAEKR